MLLDITDKNLEIVSNNSKGQLVQLFNLYIYPPDSQESDGGINTSNYPNLLQRCQGIAVHLKFMSLIFYFYREMIEV